MLRACSWGCRAKNLAERAAYVATASVNGRPERCRPGSALPQLLSTLPDEFAFRRISRIDVCVLPIQIEHRWQDIAASTPPPSDLSADQNGRRFRYTQERVTERVS